MDPVSSAKRIHPEVVKWRRELHRMPEFIFDLPKTSAFVAEKLTEIGIEHQVIAKSGIVGLIRGAKKGPTIALRADMDAVKLREETGLPFSSTCEYMHACGHDAHTAMLLGAAKILSSNRDILRGDVKLLFQPAEEHEGGALPMINEGCMDNPKVDTIVAFHVGQLFEGVSPGQIGVRYGPIMAAIDTVHVTVKGQGGHSARPHLCVDAITTASEMILSLQKIISRELNSNRSAVITVGQVHGGTSAHIMPNEVSFSATVRTLDPDDRDFIEERVKSLCHHIAKANRCDVDVAYLRYYPATINDEKTTRAFTASATKVVGPENVIEIREPSMGGDDMAYFLQLVPGTYVTLCTNNPEKGIVYPNHHPKFDVDEDFLWIGSATFVQFVLDYLEESARY